MRDLIVSLVQAAMQLVLLRRATPAWLERASGLRARCLAQQQRVQLQLRFQLFASRVLSASGLRAECVWHEPQQGVRERALAQKKRGGKVKVAEKRAFALLAPHPGVDQKDAHTRNVG